MESCALAHHLPRMSQSDTVDVFELRYTKAELAAAPEAERQFYLMATGLANDIQILLRQYVIALKQHDEDEARRNASSTIAMLNLRLLAGRFQEGWVLVEKHWPGLDTAYRSMLSPKGGAALDELHTYFAVKESDNVVYMIRNKIGFHSDYKFTRKMFNQTPDETEMVDYIGQALGDTLFFGSEVTHYAALRDLTGEADDVAAFGAVMDELRTLQNLFLTFVHAYVAVFATRNLASQYAVIRSHRRTITDLPALNDHRIPYFADFSANAAAAQAAKSADANGTTGSEEVD